MTNVLDLANPKCSVVGRLLILPSALRNMMLCDDKGRSVRLTIWNDLVDEMDSFGPQIYSTFEIERVKWITTPTDQRTFNHGTSMHELEFQSNSTIRLKKPTDLMNIKFVKIAELTVADQYATVSIRFKLKNINVYSSDSRSVVKGASLNLDRDSGCRFERHLN